MRRSLRAAVVFFLVVLQRQCIDCKFFVNAFCMKIYIRNNILVTIVALAFVCALGACMPRGLFVLLPSAQRYEIYCRHTTLPCTDNGICREVHATPDNLRATLDECRYIDGITAVLSKETDVDTLIKNMQAEVIDKQQLPDMTIYTCHSRMVSGGVTVDNQTVNLQIAVTATAVHVGSPLLLGSY